MTDGIPPGTSPTPPIEPTPPAAPTPPAFNAPDDMTQWAPNAGSPTPVAYSTGVGYPAGAVQPPQAQPVAPAPPSQPAYPVTPGSTGPSGYPAPTGYPAPSGYPAPTGYPAPPTAYASGPAAPAPAGSRGPGRAAVWVPTVVAVLALAGAGFLGWKWHESAANLDEVRTTQHAVIAEAEAQRTDSEDARKAAVDYAKLLTTVDYRHLDENNRKLVDGATGKWKDNYAENSSQLKELLTSNKATSTGQVVASAVDSVNGKDVTVLLFVDQSVSNTNQPDPRLDKSRMKMTMTKVDGRWLTSNIEIL